MSRCISRAGEYGDHVLADTGTAVERFVCSRCFVVAEDELFAEIESLRAKLAAVEQERDTAREKWMTALDMNARGRERADRAEAALAAVRELADRTLTFGGSDIEGWVNLADLRHALAAAEQDEPKREQS